MDKIKTRFVTPLITNHYHANEDKTVKWGIHLDTPSY